MLTITCPKGKWGFFESSNFRITVTNTILKFQVNLCEPKAIFQADLTKWVMLKQVSQYIPGYISCQTSSLYNFQVKTIRNVNNSC